VSTVVDTETTPAGACPSCGFDADDVDLFAWHRTSGWCASATPAPAPAPRPRPRRTSTRSRGGQPLTPNPQWVAAYRAGATVPEIAAAHGTWPPVVRRHLRRAGVELRDDRATRSGGANRLPPLDVAEIERLHDQGLTYRQVAARLGVGATTVMRARGKST